MNVQLSSREAVKVWIEEETKRVLGFTPENARFLGAAGIRAKSYTLLHAHEIEGWVAKYREQQERDAEEAAILTIQRESRFRKAIRSAIEQRNQSVNQFNRDLNNTFLRLMDSRYDQILQSKLHPIVHGFNEAYEASTDAHEFALDSPYFKHGPETVAEGSRGGDQ
jgi:hypothetical protein